MISVTGSDVPNFGTPVKEDGLMSYGEQQKEIETIRERKITVKLSAADCDRLAIKCGEHGLTIGELIENFVGDLVGGTYSNESDENIVIYCKYQKE